MKNVFFFLFLFIASRSPAQLSDISGWNTKVDLQFHSILQYPPGWQPQDLEEGYVVTSPMESDSDHYRENLIFFAAEASDSVMKMDVKDYAESTFIALKKNIQDVRVMVNKYVTVNGIRMYLVVYNGLFNGQYLYCKQLFCLYQNVAYMLSYNGEAGKKDHFAIPSGDMLFSFRPSDVKQG